MDPITVSILVAIFDGVLKSIPEAITAYEAIQRMAAEKRDPSPAEWQQMALAMAVIHAEVQGTPAADPVPASDPAAPAA
jgi:hypothetical protein